MKVIRLKAIVVSILCLLCVLLLPIFLTSCLNGYTDEELAEIQATFESFDNNKNYAVNCEGRYLYLQEKRINIKELNYKGKEIDLILGEEDEYCYLYTSERKANSSDIYIIKLYYDTLEMEEVVCMKGLDRDAMHWRSYEDNKVLFGNDYESYIFCDLLTGEQRTCSQKDLSWQKEKKYSYETDTKNKNSWITITDNQTGQQKTVSWREDLNTFEEGQYILQLKCQNPYVGVFIELVEKDGECYILSWIPVSGMGLFGYEVVIFTYDFENDILDYYSALKYSGTSSYPSLTIIDRK